MRLYPLTGDVPAVDHPVHGHFEPARDGGFDFPPPLFEHLHAVAVGRQKQWETQIERQERLIREELARRQSPEALYEAVSRLVTAAEASTPAPARAEPAKAAPAARPAAKPGDAK